jgi:hypothetical protein
MPLLFPIDDSGDTILNDICSFKIEQFNMEVVAKFNGIFELLYS